MNYLKFTKEEQKLFSSLKDISLDNYELQPLIFDSWNKGLPSYLQPRYGTKYPKLSSFRKKVQSKNSVGRVWLTDGKKSVYIKKNQIWDYLNQGFYLGRKFVRKNPTTKFLSCSCLKCKRQIQVNNLSNHYKFSH